MSDVFYLRPVDPPIAPADLEEMSRHAGGCFDLHRVEWLQSFLAADGRRMLCRYRAPDAESARLALRQLGSDMKAVWPGTIIGDDKSGPPLSDAGMLAEFYFEEPQSADAAAAKVADTARLGRHRVTHVRGLVSTCGTRMACVFRSQGEAQLRSALEAVGLSAQAIWACIPFSPQVKTLRKAL
jgi:hypothetical protein